MHVDEIDEDKTECESSVLPIQLCANHSVVVFVQVVCACVHGHPFFV